MFTQIGLSSYCQSFVLFCSACAENLRAGRISSRNIFAHAIQQQQLKIGRGRAAKAPGRDCYAMTAAVPTGVLLGECSCD